MQLPPCSCLSPLSLVPGRSRRGARRAAGPPHAAWRVRRVCGCVWLGGRRCAVAGRGGATPRTLRTLLVTARTAAVHGAASSDAVARNSIRPRAGGRHASVQYMYSKLQTSHLVISTQCSVARSPRAHRTRHARAPTAVRRATLISNSDSSTHTVPVATQLTCSVVYTPTQLRTHTTRRDSLKSAPWSLSLHSTTHTSPERPGVPLRSALRRPTRPPAATAHSPYDAACQGSGGADACNP